MTLAASTLTLGLLAALVAHDAAAASREVRSGARTSVNAGSVSRGSTDVKRNVNVSHHVDVDVDVDNDYHPWATAAAVTTAAVVTSAVIGSMVQSLPPSCQTVVIAGISYSQCAGTWYMPQMQGSSVIYVVVAPPR